MLLHAALIAAAFSAGSNWKDAKSGREYLLLDDEVTWNDADRLCNSHGYALFDLRYVTDDERKDLLANPALEKLGWETLYAGTSRETQLAHLWQGSQAA